MYDLPEPKENERIAKVVATRGGNQFDVLVAASSSSSRPTLDDLDSSTNENEDATSCTVVHQLLPKTTSTPQLALLPTKFNKLVWLKRNDFVIVETGDDATKEQEQSNVDEGGVRFMISHILYKDQIKHLLRKGLWPIEDPNFQTELDMDRTSKAVAEEDQELRDCTSSKYTVQTLGESDFEQYDSDQDDEADVESEEEHLATSSSAYLATSRADDGIVYDNGYSDDFFVNTNRIASMKIQDSSDSEDDDDNDE